MLIAPCRLFWYRSVHATKDRVKHRAAAIARPLEIERLASVCGTQAEGGAFRAYHAIPRVVVE